jgi:hypothetical protein
VSVVSVARGTSFARVDVARLVRVVTVSMARGTSRTRVDVARLVRVVVALVFASVVRPARRVRVRRVMHA